MQIVAKFEQDPERVFFYVSPPLAEATHETLRELGYEPTGFQSQPPAMLTDNTRAYTIWANAKTNDVTLEYCPLGMHVRQIVAVKTRTEPEFFCL